MYLLVVEKIVQEMAKELLGSVRTEFPAFQWLLGSSTDLAVRWSPFLLF
jgi:hypothetical protein